MKLNGIYFIKDQFFDDMQDPYLKTNKDERRPHYYCLADTARGIYWMIPMSSKLDKYRRLIQTRLDAGKSCDILYIAKLDNGKESVFLIQDMFPVTEQYIAGEYLIGGNHLTVTSEHTVKEIERRARRVMGMIKRGVKFTPTQPDIKTILKKLQQDMKR